MFIVMRVFIAIIVCYALKTVIKQVIVAILYTVYNYGYSYIISLYFESVL